MTPAGRVIVYVNLGYSAERIAELLGWQVDIVRRIKAEQHVFGGASNVVQIHTRKTVEGRPQA